MFRKDFSILPMDILSQPFEDFIKEMVSTFGYENNRAIEQIKNKSSYPKTDIISNDKGYIFKFAVPGLKQEEVDVCFENDTLTVKNIKNENIGKEKNNYLINELKHSSFIRSWKLSEKIDLDNISAKLENGILQVEVPLQQPKNNELPQAKKIEIK